MKRCPECRRDYFDDTLSFCLADGTSLVYGLSNDEPATAILSEPPPSAGGRFSEGLTRAQVHTTESEAEPRESLGDSPDRQTLSADRTANQRTGTMRRIGTAAILLAALCGVGFAIYK